MGRCRLLFFFFSFPPFYSPFFSFSLFLVLVTNANETLPFLREMCALGPKWKINVQFKIQRRFSELRIETWDLHCTLPPFSNPVGKRKQKSQFLFLFLFFWTKLKQSNNNRGCCWNVWPLPISQLIVRK